MTRSLQTVVGKMNGRKQEPPQVKSRSSIGIAIGLLLVATCVGQQARTADFTDRPHSPLQRTLAELASEARPGTLGIEVRDLRNGRTWRVNADRAFPLMSVFKAPLGATVLAKV